jgi:hypothetical protein
MAHLVVGEREIAVELFDWTRQHRLADGRYWTGTVYPDGSHFPPDERSSYTAAAIVLCADAMSGSSPASGLFVDHDAAVPPLIDVDALDRILDPDDA